jgi:hypothetical protein
MNFGEVEDNFQICKGSFEYILNIIYTTSSITLSVDEFNSDCFWKGDFTEQG